MDSKKLSPDYEGIELGIGESLLIKAIAESTGRSLAVIKADLKREGDLGLVAMVSNWNIFNLEHLLIFCVELEKQPKDIVQTQAADPSLRILLPKRNCHHRWPLGTTIAFSYDSGV
jgi:hypothetical protein